MFIIKFHQGAHGVQRDDFDKAITFAVEQRPATVYKAAVEPVKMATVHVDGGIDFTPEGADERRLAVR